MSASVSGAGSRRFALLIRQAMYNLRGGFLVRPLSIALALGCAGGLISWLDEEFPWLSDWVPKVIFPSHSDPQVAQIILSGIATSIMTVVSIVFAILLMTLTLASMQFSPRIIVSFSQDRVTQWTLGIFLGTFLYCMAALPAARSLPYPFAPIDTVMGAILLSIACVAWLLFFIHHISRAISVNYIVDKIASDTEAVIDEIVPWPRHEGGYRNAAPPPSIEWDGRVASEGSGYIRFIDTARLVALAKEHRVKIRVLRRAGQFIPAGVSLLAVARGDRLSPDVTRDLLGAFDLGPSRTLQQDVEFGVLQIVEHRAQGDLTRRERPDYRDQLRGSTKPYPDSLCLTRAAGLISLRPARSGPREHCLDRLRQSSGVGAGTDSNVRESGCGRESAAAARAGGHRLGHARSAVPTDVGGQGKAYRRRLRRKTERRGDAEPPRPVDGPRYLDFLRFGFEIVRFPRAWNRNE